MAYDGSFCLMYVPVAGNCALRLRSIHPPGLLLVQGNAVRSFPFTKRTLLCRPSFTGRCVNIGWQVVHAAALGTETGGVLLVGNTGAGKSTTALAMLEQRNSHTPRAALPER